MSLVLKAARVASKLRKKTYSSYIHKVLKQVHRDTGISNKDVDPRLCRSSIQLGRTTPFLMSKQPSTRRLSSVI
ncbi:hypothetical protein K438DRAFT_1962733 [Mycena galopus ATCC 62051]|nr:hypothetical protein K438DRAFT_1962733 [Mycena galopus ATCC 62051]